METQKPLELRTRKVGPWPMNTYALVCPHTNESILFDPGADPDTLEDMLNSTTPVAILLTHTHPDHVGALTEMLERLDVPLYAHENAQAKGYDAERSLKDGDSVELGKHTLNVYYAPGHIDDQICLALEDNRVIVGDTIFAGGPGKTWTSEGFKQSFETLRNVVLPWPDDTICYPGHGDSFRLGDKRPLIESFLAKDHGNFFGNAKWEM